jgi:hypothetical protein
VSIADLRNEWLALLEADLAGRVTRAEWDANERERISHPLLEELEKMAERLVVGSRSTNNLELALELTQAQNWSEIDVIRLRADLSPATAVALVYTRNPEHAFQLLGEYSRQSTHNG